MPKPTRLAQTGFTLSESSKEIFQDLVFRLQSNHESKQQLKTEMTILNEDKKNVLREASGMGFDKRVIEEVLALLELEKSGGLRERQEMDDTLALYLDMLDKGYLAPGQHQPESESEDE